MDHGRYLIFLIFLEQADAKHVGALGIDPVEFEPVAYVFKWNDRSKRTECLAMLNPAVKYFLAIRPSRVAENATLPECPGTEFGSSLKPPDNFSLYQKIGGFGNDVFRLQDLSSRRFRYRLSRRRSRVTSPDSIMKQSLAGVLLAEVPEAIVCGANGRTTVFRGRYDVNVFEFRLANDPLIGHA